MLQMYNCQAKTSAVLNEFLYTFVYTNLLITLLTQHSLHISPYEFKEFTISLLLLIKYTVCNNITKII